MVTTEHPPFPGGIATYAGKFSEAATRAGWIEGVTVVCPEGSIPAVDTVGLTTYPHRKDTFCKSDLLPLVFAIAKESRRRDFQIVHAVDWPSCVALSLVNVALKLPFIVTVHGTDLATYAGLLRRRLWRSRLLSQATGIVANSQFTMKAAKKALQNFVHPPISYAYLGSRQKSPGDHRLPDCIPTGKRIVLTLSRVERRKGHLHAVEALLKLPDAERKSIHYVIAGRVEDESYLNSLRQLLLKSDISWSILGAVDSSVIAALYGSAHLFLLPGDIDQHRFEGFGLVYLEAAAEGVPSIAYDLSAVPEVVVDGVTGLLSDHGDIGGLEQNIRRLLTDESLHIRLSYAAAERAKEFTWERCVDQTYHNFSRSPTELTALGGTGRKA